LDQLAKQSCIRLLSLLDLLSFVGLDVIEDAFLTYLCEVLRKWLQWVVCLGATQALEQILTAQLHDVIEEEEFVQEHLHLALCLQRWIGHNRSLPARRQPIWRRDYFRCRLPLSFRGALTGLRRLAHVAIDDRIDTELVH